MQVARVPDIEMKRDMDLIRELLIGIEADQRLDGKRWIEPDAQDNFGVVGVSSHSAKEVAYHLEMLMDAGLIEGKCGLAEMPRVSKLTWQGHEFLDNIRDSGIWGKTKKRLEGLPSVAFAVVVELAKAEARKYLGLT